MDIRASLRILGCCFLPLAALGQVSGQADQGLAPFSTFLKANSTVNSIATGPDGSIYVLGQVATNGQDIFVSRLDRTGSKLTWSISFGGTGLERPGGLAVDSAGNIYFAGTTNSPDFPVFPKTPLPQPANNFIPFAVKLDPNGMILYSTLFTGSVRATPEAVAVDNAGRLVITGTSGSSGLAATPGAYSSNWNPNAPPFIVKLDAGGTKTIFSVVGVGGSRLVIDPAGDIYVAGSGNFFFFGGQLYPTTAGALQTTYQPSGYCVSPSCGIPYAAGQQYITKLSADGSRLLYSTFLTGPGGTLNAGLAVDADGSAWVTGKANTSAYPYTESLSDSSRPGMFTTKIDPTGSKVLLSVRQGGSTLSLDRQGNIVVADSFPAVVPFTQFGAGIAIPDPSTGTTPPECLPVPKSRLSRGAFAMRLSGKDGAVLTTRILTGSKLDQIVSTLDNQGNIVVGGNTALPDTAMTPGAAFDDAIKGRNVFGVFVARAAADLGTETKLGCVTDATSSALTSLVAPGQLITIYGKGIGPDQPVAGIGGGAQTVPTSLGGVVVSFDGRPAPLLYVSAGQLNVQVPFEVQQDVTTMEVSLNGSVVASRQFAVIPRNPGLFVSPVPSLTCGGVTYNERATAFALNQDGSRNSCDNPAKPGSQVTLFVNGLGNTVLRKVTGAINGPDPAPISAKTAAFSFNYSLEVDSFAEQAGAIAGLGQVRLRVPDTSGPLLSVTLSVNDEPAGPFLPEGLVPAPVSAGVFVKP